MYDLGVYSIYVQLQESAEDLASYMILLRAQYLLIISYYYKEKKDYKRILREYKACNK
jgi:hypothetical protein